MKAVTLPKAQYLSRQGSGFVVFRPHSSYSAALVISEQSSAQASRQTSLTFLEAPYILMALGPKRPYLLWLGGPSSIMVVYMEPLGF